MDIQNALSPIEQIQSNGVESTFSNIAKNLFNHFCIECGSDRFFFGEIEFYYFDENNRNPHWDEETYPRKNKEYGDIFYHLSGMDICFEGNLTKPENKLTKQECKLCGKGGGILVRSVIRESDGKLFVGPLTCANELLNSCNGKTMPRIVGVEGRNVDPTPVHRYFGERYLDNLKNKDQKTKNKDGNLKLAFYDATAFNDSINNKKDTAKYCEKRIKYDPSKYL